MLLNKSVKKQKNSPQRFCWLHIKATSLKIPGRSKKFHVSFSFQKLIQTLALKNTKKIVGGQFNKI